MYSFKELSGMLPSNVAKNITFLLTIQKILSSVLTLLPKEVTKIDITNGTSESEVRLSYKISINGCNAASILATKLRSVMGSGYFIERLRNYTGIAELYISEPSITVNATIGLPKRASVTASESGACYGSCYSLNLLTCHSIHCKPLSLPHSTISM